MKDDLKKLVTKWRTTAGRVRETAQRLDIFDVGVSETINAYETCARELEEELRSENES